MKVLVIGASGMLAKPVIEEFDKKGFQLRLFSRNVNQDMFIKDYEIVNGDVLKSKDLEIAIKGCDAIHINLSGVDEAVAVQKIVKIAAKEGIKLISTISGCTVLQENRWFPMIDNKFRADQELIQSGIPYIIFRASWFFESLQLMVRNNRITQIGKQKNPYHWIAARDYAHMVGAAYATTEARNKIFYVLGTQTYTMSDLLDQYREFRHPDIKKVNSISTGMLKFIAMLSRNKQLKTVADMFKYFEKTKEHGDPLETYQLLGKPKVTFQKWLETVD